MSVRNFFATVAIFILVCIAAPMLHGQVHSSSSYRYLLTEEGAMEHIGFLCSEKIAGRAAGTPQAKEVADYIARAFEQYGLQPFRSVSYFQPFSLANQKVSGSSYIEQYRQRSQGNNADVKKGYNVIGYLPAKNKNADYIIVGAHFDHIGAIGDKFYPGADDNSSGVAAMLEVAKALGKRFVEKNDLEHNIVFVGFDANNLNMQGSRYFVQKMGIPVHKVTCMLNLDQIGSSLAPVGKNPEYLLILGAEHLSGWQREQISFANEFFALGLQLDFSYYGSEEFYKIFYRLSDQKSFADAGIPALLFTSGITKHTNKESDIADNLNPAVLLKRIELIYSFLWLLI